MNSCLSIDSNKSDSATNLIGDIYYSSGLSKEVFNKIYIATLNKYLKSIAAEQHDAILNSITLALRKRRTTYLPDGVRAEDVHKNKDVWTFIVFLAGIIIHSKTENVRVFLNELLSGSVLNWLADKQGDVVLFSINDNDEKNSNVLMIRSFYGFNSIKNKMEDLSLNDIKTSDAALKSEVENVSLTDKTKADVDKPTNKEVGRLFLIWVLDHAIEKGSVAYAEGNNFFVKSPLAFIEFSKANDYMWKSVQKGTLKLGLHEINIERGTPFHKVKGCNVIKYETAIKVDLLD